MEQFQKNLEITEFPQSEPFNQKFLEASHS